MRNSSIDIPFIKMTSSKLCGQLGPNSSVGPLIVGHIFLLLLLLLLPLPTEAENKERELAYGGAGAQHQGGRSCNRETEFECQIDGRCIPNEWRCDFTEQCPDGQDEWGCLPDKCNFDRDLCNWQNHLDHDHHDDQQKEPASANQRSPVRQSPWRRLSHNGRLVVVPSVEGGSATAPKIGANRTLGPNPMLKRLEQLGEQLLPAAPESRSKASSKFLFVPLLVEPASFPSAEPNTTLKSDGPTQGKPGKIRSAKSTRLGAPLISQTNSMCQLRFKYSLWMSQRQLAWQTEIKGEERSLELKLVARDRFGKERLLWTGSVCAQATPARDQQDAASIEEASPTWLVEVIELGHERGIELYLQAEFASYSGGQSTRELSAVAAAAASLEQPTEASDVEKNSNSASSAKGQVRQQQQQQLVAAFAAIGWFNFRHCGWPQGATHPSGDGQQNHLTDDYFWAAEMGPVVRPPAEVAKAAAADDSTFVCPRGKFMCPSNRLCIDSGRVCNFVDDCMSSSSSSLLLSDSVALEMGKQQSPSEDESPSGVCKNVPGMDDFEPAQDTKVRARLVVRRQNQPHSAQANFWSLAGNWPADKVKLQSGAINNGDRSNQAAAAAAHWPRKDHTPNRRGRGHYLALEIPGPQNSLAEPKLRGRKKQPTTDTNQAGGLTHWIYLESPWLKKAPRTNATTVADHDDDDYDDDYESDCRVKFSYNLVASGEKTLYLGTTLPFNLYLMVEHVIMPTVSSATVSPPQPILDSLIYLRPKAFNDEDQLPEELLSSSSRRQAMIEWPGVDFWRELNHPLMGLQDNDIFYIRLTLMVVGHGDDLRKTPQLASFSFDDLSTHLGCSSIGLDEAFQRQAERFRLDTRLAPTLRGISQANVIGNGKFRHSYNDDNSDADEQKSSDEGAIQIPQQLDGGRKNLYQHRSLQFEPHRLILYVLAIFVSMFGLIFMIVFIVVPHVERAVINFHDQLLLSLNDDMDYTPRNSIASISRDIHHHSSGSLLSGEACELTTNGSDWDHLATPGGRWRYPSAGAAAGDGGAAGHYFDESFLTNDSVLTILDSDSYSQRLSSVGDSYVVLQDQSDSSNSKSDLTTRSNSNNNSTNDDGSTLTCDRNSDSDETDCV